MSKPVPKSRLTITYRTKIDGVVKKKRLPLRLLVLGNFSGVPEAPTADGRPQATVPRLPYEKREVLSIRPGISVASFMNELGLACQIDDPDLRSVVPATLHASLVGSVKPGKDGDVVVTLSGAGHIEADGQANGLCSLAGSVQVSGQCKGTRTKGQITLEDASLVINGKAEGDMSGLVNYECKLAIATAPVNEDELKFVIKTVVPVSLTIPMRTMQCFTPQHVANSIPEIHRLVVIRRLLGEVRNMVSARPDVRQGMKLALSDDQLNELHAWSQQNFPELALPADGRELAKARAQALAAA